MRMASLIALTVAAGLLVSAPAGADALVGTLLGETWVQSHTPDGSGFDIGINGAGDIPGNEIGGQLRWVFEGVVIGRATVINFQVPALPAGQVVTDVELALYDTEGGNSDSVMQVGWTTGGTADLAGVTFNALGGGIDMGNSAFTFTDVQFDPDLGASGPTVSALPQQLPLYVDAVDGDGGLAEYVAANMGSAISIVLSPWGDANHIALIHGSDVTTEAGPGDPVGTLPDAAFFPALTVNTIPEPASLALLALGGLLAARRRR